MKPTGKSTEQLAKLLMRSEKKRDPANQEGLQERMQSGLQWLGFMSPSGRKSSLLPRTCC